MSDVVLREPLASNVRAEAQAQGIDVEELINTALRHYRFRAQQEKINDEAAWWRSAMPEMRGRYLGEFVAIHNHEIVDHDRDEEALKQWVRVKYGKTAILITPAAGRRELFIVSTRLVSA
ncbi:MAG: hypothetical protein QMD04_03940 [Anaerolineales bacterium]|nr:hypothetical protein [Anaerolineales bacterium]